MALERSCGQKLETASASLYRAAMRSVHAPKQSIGAPGFIAGLVIVLSFFAEAVTAAPARVQVEETQGLEVVLTVEADSAPTFQVYQAQRDARGVQWIVELPSAALTAENLAVAGKGMLVTDATAVAASKGSASRVVLTFADDVDFDADTKKRTLAVRFHHTGERSTLVRAYEERMQKLAKLRAEEAKKLEDQRAALEAENAEKNRLAAVAKEAEKKKRDEEDAKRAAIEAEQRRVAELAKEAEKKRVAEEIEKKRVAEEAEKKRLADIAEQKRLAEAAEKKRLAEEAEKKRVAEEAEKKRLAELAEQKRLAEIAEQKRLAEIAEKKRLAEEAEKKRVAEEAEKRRLAEEAKRKEEERRAAEIEAKKRKELEERLAAQRAAEEAEKKRAAELAEKKRLAEEAERAEQKRLADLAEQKRLADLAEQKRLAEIAAREAAKKEQERKAQEQERLAALEAEKQRKLESQRRVEEALQEEKRKEEKRKEQERAALAAREAQQREEALRAEQAKKAAPRDDEGFGGSTTKTPEMKIARAAPTPAPSFGGTPSIEFSRGGYRYERVALPKERDEFGGYDDDDDESLDESSGRSVLSQVTVQKSEQGARVGVRVDGGARYHVARRGRDKIVLTLVDTRAQNLTVRRALDARALGGPVLRVLPSVDEDRRYRIELVIETSGQNPVRIQQDGQHLWLEVAG